MELLQSFVEYRQWGWNATIAGAILVASLSFIEFYALALQGVALYRERSGKSLNVLFIAYGAFLSLATAAYGWETRALTLLWNGLGAGLLGVWALIGLYRYKRFTSLERFLVPYFIFLPIVMFSPWRQIAYTIAPIGFAVSGITQLREILSKGRGVVEIKFLIAYVVLSGAWITFGLAVGDWAIWAPQVVFFVIFLLTVIAWYRAPRISSGAAV